MQVINEQDGVRCAAVSRYFTPTPTPPVPVAATPAHIMLGLGILLLLSVCGMVRESGHLASAAVLLVSAAGLFAASMTIYRRASAYERSSRRFTIDWAQAEPKPSDRQMQRWLARDVEAIQARGLPLGREPHTLIGIADEARTTTGHDGRVRADRYHVLTFFPAHSGIGIHRCHLDFATGEVTDEQKHRIPYGGGPLVHDDGSDRLTVRLPDGTCFVLTVGAEGRPLAWPNYRTMAALDRVRTWR